MSGAWLKLNAVMLRPTNMNVFVYELAEGEPPPDSGEDRLVIEDNVGEAIHLHYRQFRLDMTIDDFRTFASKLEQAMSELTDGD